MTDISKLDPLAKAISTYSGKIRAYAIEQARVSVEQETRLRKLEAPAPTPTPVPSASSPDILRWRKVSDVPDMHDATNGRVSDAVLLDMPAGVSSVLKVSVTGASDSSGGGDASYLTTGNMNEPWITEGAETWLALWILVPDGTDSRYPGKFTVPKDGSVWATFFDWHEPAIAPLSTHIGIIAGNVWQARWAGGSTINPTVKYGRDTVPSARNRWQRHIMRTKWSRYAQGSVEWWIDDRKIIPPASDAYGSPWPTSFPTAWDSNGIKGGYFQCGLYRGPSRADTDTIYMADVMVASTRERLG